jgi:hypothetical protein
MDSIKLTSKVIDGAKILFAKPDEPEEGKIIIIMPH